MGVTAPRHAFISYVHEDADAVDRLCAELRVHGVTIWLDRDDLRPGVRWRDEIRTAVRTGSFFIACFSPRSEDKERSYMREELVLALDELRLRATDRAWFIPVLLAPCVVPDLPVGGGASLADLQYVDLSSDWERGISRLVDAFVPQAHQVETLRKCAEERRRAADLAGCADALAHAMRLSPGDESIAIEFAAAAVRLGRYTEAVGTFERLAAIRPTSAEVRYLLGIAAWLSGKIDEALSALSRARMLDDTNALVWFDYGAMLYGQGRMPEARAAFARCVELRPDAIETHQALLRTLLRVGTQAELTSAADAFHERFGAHADVHEARALVGVEKFSVLAPPFGGGTGEVLLSVGQDVEREGRQALICDPKNVRRTYRIGAMFNLCHLHDAMEWAARRGIALCDGNTRDGHFQTLLGIVAEYRDRSLDGYKQYGVGACRDPDIELEDPFPVLDADGRLLPVPNFTRWPTVPLQLWGVASAGPSVPYAGRQLVSGSRGLPE